MAQWYGLLGPGTPLFSLTSFSMSHRNFLITKPLIRIDCYSVAVSVNDARLIDGCIGWIRDWHVPVGFSRAARRRLLRVLFRCRWLRWHSTSLICSVVPVNIEQVFCYVFEIADNPTVACSRDDVRHLSEKISCWLVSGREKAEGGNHSLTP